MATSKRPLAAALGAAFLASSIAPLVAAEVNPFSAQQLNSGYNLANYDKHVDGTCGDKGAEGSTDGTKAEGEGSCGDKKADGEGKCGEGKCGDKKADGEGKCGEGKCGGQ